MGTKNVAKLGKVGGMMDGDNGLRLGWVTGTYHTHRDVWSVPL